MPITFSWRPIAVLAIAAILAQAAILQAFRQFTSEVVAQRASTLTDRSLFSQAHIEAQRAAELYPYNAYALFRLGAAEFAGGSARENQARAAQSLEKALVYITHKPNVLRLLGQSYYFLGRYGEAAAVMDSLIRMVPKPEEGAAHLMLIRGLAHFRADEGQRQGRAAMPISRAGDLPEVQADIAIPELLNLLYLNMPHSAESLIREWIDRGVDQKLTTTQVQELFAAAQATGRFQLLTGILSSALTGDKRHSRLSKYLASAYLKAEQPTEAATLVQELRRQFPEDADYPLLLGDIELKRQNKPAAREHYREHLRLQPDSSFRQEIIQKVGPLP